MYITRKIEPKLINHLKNKEYTIITGARQTGKTTILKSLYERIKKKENIAVFISLEDIDVLNSINKHPEEIFSIIPRPNGNTNKNNNSGNPYYLFIDEIQYANNPTNFLKYLYDTYGDKLKIIATGSSAFYMDKKFKDSLAGRKRIFELTTLSFDEWLLFQKKNELIRELELIRENKEYVSTKQRELTELFNIFIIYGGYPRIALEPDFQEKRILLKELKNSFLRKDIDESGINQVEKFYILFSLLASQTGNLVNRNELAGTVGVDNKTIDKYLFVLQNSFHITLLKPFFSNLRKELTKMPKVFFNDTGMRNIILNRFYNFNNRDDNGALFENYIFNRLREISDKENIRYWRTSDNKEIDFVVNESFNKGKAYEVKIKCPRNKQLSQIRFTEKYPGYPLETISYNHDNKCLWALKL